MTAPLNLSETAVVIIDMQRDFLEPNGFGELLGNDVSKLQRAVQPCKSVLEACRERGMLILHTREVSICMYVCMGGWRNVGE